MGFLRFPWLPPRNSILVHCWWLLFNPRVLPPSPRTPYTTLRLVLFLSSRSAQLCIMVFPLSVVVFFLLTLSRAPDARPWDIGRTFMLHGTCDGKGKTKWGNPSGPELSSARPFLKEMLPGMYPDASSRYKFPGYGHQVQLGFRMNFGKRPKPRRGRLRHKIARGPPCLWPL